MVDLNNTKPENERALELLSALSDPTRLQIVQLLASIRGIPVTVGLISDHVKVRSSVCSHHLGLLRSAGWIRYESCGANRLYSIVESAVKELEGQLEFLQKKERPSETPK